ncbi:MAG: hypothetical protein HIU89_09120 [Proteobacteria bacterium]|nr:hypothetical protein [Pseudomonadota bacterium]
MQGLDWQGGCAWLASVTEDGNFLRYRSGFGPAKAEMKAQGLAPELLTGSGDVAGMVRLPHGLRAGMKVTPMADDQ